MKVSVADFEMHLIPFLKQIADTMPTSLHKWIGGAMVASSTSKIERFLGGQTDKDGMIDLDKMRKLVDSGFSASGGEVVIPFGSDTLSSFGISPVNVKIHKADTDGFFDGFSK